MEHLKEASVHMGMCGYIHTYIHAHTPLPFRITLNRSNQTSQFYLTIWQPPGYQFLLGFLSNPIIQTFHPSVFPSYIKWFWPPFLSFYSSEMLVTNTFSNLVLLSFYSDCLAKIVIVTQSQSFHFYLGSLLSSAVKTSNHVDQNKKK